MTAKKAALEAEANSSTTVREIEHEGKTYVIETDLEEWPLAVMKSYEEGKSIAVVEALLGPRQWGRFMATNPKTRDFTALAEVVFKAIGTNEGESQD